MSRSVKRALLALPLAAAACCFGWMCARLGQAYDQLLFPAAGLLWLLLQLLCSLWFLSVGAGLAAALVRPLRAAMVAFALSGVAMLAGLGWSAAGGIAVLLYLLAALAYARRVCRELEQRTAFASGSVSDAQSVLTMALVFVASCSVYTGFAARIEAEGFTIPPAYKEGVTERLEAAVESYLPEVVRDLALDVIREGVAFAVDEVLVAAVEPFQESIPLIAAAVLFTPLLAVTRLLAWVPAVALEAAFAALQALRVVRVVRTTREVERLVLW